MTDETNPAERRRWNDEHWSTYWPKRERFTDAVTPILLDAAALQPGERVLDIGSGGGKTTIEAGRRVGLTGTVVGADLSTPLVTLARRRVLEAGSSNVRFDIVDMQYAEVVGAPFDVALSQLGVMFFDEPLTAFTNIARHLDDGGRIVFACWQAAERNPWILEYALAPFRPPAPPLGPGKSPTGPCALADADRTAGILRDAGFSAIERTTFDFTIEVPQDALVDDNQLASMVADEADIPAARRAVEEHLSAFRIDNELSRFPLSLQLFSGRH